MSTTVPPARHLAADIVIIGGGIAGLWMLNRLVSEGYQVLLLEASALGQGQSIASQGIIHGGLKYALDGSLGGAVHAIAGMPARWRSCLAGDGDVDLRGCRLLSECYYMWSDGGVRSRLKTFLGSKSLRGRVETLSLSQRPRFFQQQATGGTIYRLPDFVIDATSLLSTLARHQQDRLLLVDHGSLDFVRDAHQQVTAVRLTVAGAPLQVAAQAVILSAGAGNGELARQAGLAIPMQLRPLRMVMVKSPHLPALYCHCIGDSFSLTPRLTITSHPSADGSIVWYLGGELAEQGVSRSDEEQQQAAAALLRSLFPGLALDDARWDSFLINRAEARVSGQHRPDSVFVHPHANLLLTWPTKFTLSPALADAVVTQLRTQQLMPRCSERPVLDGLPVPAVARTPWAERFD